MRVAEVDVTGDGPEVVALRVEEGLAYLPGAVAGALDVGELVAARLGGEEQLAVLGEERRRLGLEALGVPRRLLAAGPHPAGRHRSGRRPSGRRPAPHRLRRRLPVTAR